MLLLVIIAASKYRRCTYIGCAGGAQVKRTKRRESGGRWLEEREEGTEGGKERKWRWVRDGQGGSRWVVVVRVVEREVRVGDDGWRSERRGQREDKGGHGGR